jgi:hypothetical protein
VNPRPLDVTADLEVEVGGRRMTLTGEHSRLTLTTDSLPGGSRADAKQFADMLAKTGVHVDIVDSKGRRLGEVGSGVTSLLGRFLAGSSAIKPRLRLLRRRG